MTKYIYFEQGHPILLGVFNVSKDDEFPDARKTTHDFGHEPTDIELETYIQQNFPDDQNVLLIQSIKADFRAWRAEQMHKYDLLGMWVQRGDLDPATMQPYGPITNAERQWLVAVRNFTTLITANTTPADYPQPPTRIAAI